MPRTDRPPAAWRKSSYSGGNEGGSNCVEVASAGGTIAVRDSKDPALRELAVSPAAWRSLIGRLRRADRPGDGG